MKNPNLVSVYQLLPDKYNCEVNLNGRWVPARPIGLSYLSNRFKLAWMVFTGKADALIWPEGQ
jgi:hypothetical protein